MGGVKGIQRTEYGPPTQMKSAPAGLLVTVAAVLAISHGYRQVSGNCPELCVGEGCNPEPEDHHHQAVERVLSRRPNDDVLPSKGLACSTLPASDYGSVHGCGVLGEERLCGRRVCYKWPGEECGTPFNKHGLCAPSLHCDQGRCRGCVLVNNKKNCSEWDHHFTERTFNNKLWYRTY